MNTRLFVLFSLASASACAIFVGACSSGDTTTTDGGDDATTSDVSPTPDTGTNDTGGGDTGTVPDASTTGPCSDAGNGCRVCCAMAFPDAAATVLASEETCACTTPGDCKQACNNSLCTGKVASGQCSQCVRNADAGNCAMTAQSACSNDPSCKPFEQCLQTCPNIGPTLDGGGPG